MIIQSPSINWIFTRIILLAPMLTVPSVYSQTEGDAVSSDEIRRNVLEEVLVTATKRTESARDIPQSISVFSGDMLESSGVQSVTEIVKMTPGVNFFSDGQRAAQVTVRGISSTLDQNQTTGTIFGNVSLTDPYLQLVTLDPNPFDLQSVEVLKGPQGTLFGAAALGGAVRYVPESPVFGVWESKYYAQYTEVSEGGGAPIFGAMLNMPLGDSETLALRIVAVERKDPGYVDDLRSGESDVNTLEQSGYRGILGWKPSDAWDIKLTYIKQTISSPNSGLTDNRDGRLERSFLFRPNSTDNQFELANLSVSYTFDWATLTADTAVIKKEVFFQQDQTRVLNQGADEAGEGLNLLVFNTTDITSHELRLTSNPDWSSKWSYVGGVFFNTEDYIAKINLPFGPALTPIELFPVNAGTIDVDAEVNEISFFFDVSLALNESFKIGLGGRYYQTESGGTSERTGLLFTGTSPNNSGVDEEGFSPKVSLTWNINDDYMTYFSAARGFRVGGVQPGVVTAIAESEAPKTFLSDTLDSYEVGFRLSLFESTLFLDGAVFFLDWTDTQTRVTSPSDGLSNYFTNVGGVESSGAELAIQWLLPISGFTLNVGVAYTDTYTTEDFEVSDSLTIKAGTPFPQAPLWQTATTLAYDYEGDYLNARAGLSHTFLDGARASISSDRQIYDYQQYDATVTFSLPYYSWLPELSLIGSNLTDERGIGYEDANDGVIYIRPRALTLRISGSF
jgi:iron complex outermembrane receptor protein